MAKDLLGCLGGVAIGALSEVIKNKFTPGYHPKSKYYANPAFEVDALQVTMTDLLAPVATEGLVRMRKEVKKAINAYKTKVEDLDAAANRFIDKANAKLKSVNKKISDTVDKSDLMADMILYQMAKENGNKVVYDSNFYKDVKTQIGRCGLEQIKIENKGKPAKVSDHVSKAKLEAEVNKRLEKLGLNEHEQGQYHDLLLKQAMFENEKVSSKVVGSGAKDAVKHTLLGKFLSFVGDFIEEFFETAAELALSLLTGHIVDFDAIEAEREAQKFESQIDHQEEAKLSKDNSVRSKGPHSKPATAEEALKVEAEKLVESAEHFENAALYAAWDFSDFVGSGQGLELKPMGELMPYLAEYSPSVKIAAEAA